MASRSLRLGRPPPRLANRIGATLWLRFSDRAAEQRFQSRSIRSALRFTRFTLLVGLLFYDLFGIVDPILVPQQAGDIELVRFLVITPIILGIFACSYFRWFVRVHNKAICSALLAAGLSLLYFAAITPLPASHFYVFGVCASILYSTLLSSCYVSVTISSLAIFALYQFVALRINPAPLGPTAMGEFFVAVSIYVAILGAYMRELYLRRYFANTEKLRHEYARSLVLVRHAEAASKARDEFLAHMSHELRTPLNAILGFSEVIKGQILGPLGSGRYQGYVEDIHASGSHLLTIVNDILDVAQASAGKIALTEQEVEPVTVLNACLAPFRERAAAKGVALHLSMSEPQPLLYADEHRLRQILVNLISNGVKFTSEGGAITVSAADAGDGYRIAVSDTGIGIAPRRVAEVLKPFSRSKDVYSGGNDGAGVGLALAKVLAEAHGGRLWIESELGVGTTVALVLPAHRVRPWRGGRI